MFVFWVVLVVVTGVGWLLVPFVAHNVLTSEFDDLFTEIYFKEFHSFASCCCPLYISTRQVASSSIQPLKMLTVFSIIVKDVPDLVELLWCLSVRFYCLSEILSFFHSQALYRPIASTIVCWIWTRVLYSCFGRTITTTEQLLIYSYSIFNLFLFSAGNA